MADEHGGYRKPSKPAPASGPSRYAKRTDGGPAQKVRVAPGGEYGERQEMEGIQSSAPMSDTGAPAGVPDAGVTVDPSRLTPLDAPSAHPNRDITYGLPSGPGPNPDDVFGPKGIDPQTRARLHSYLVPLMILASSDGASQETRDYVRRLRADLG